MFPAAEGARIGILALVLVTLGVASLSDWCHRRIPNWTVGALVLLYAGWASIERSVSVTQSLEAAGIAFLVSFLLYAFRLIGAGDSKLISAVALFVGMPPLAEFALVMSLAGGVLAVMSLVSHPTRALVMLQMGGRADAGRGVPYGIAIALAGAFILCRDLPPYQFSLTG
jgi:prepilin peptidase CpaA